MKLASMSSWALSWMEPSFSTHFSMPPTRSFFSLFVAHLRQVLLHCSYSRQQALLVLPGLLQLPPDCSYLTPAPGKLLPSDSSLGARI